MQQGFRASASYRRAADRGLFQALMGEVLADLGKAPAFLMTETPALFEPYGFRIVELSMFRQRLSPSHPAPRSRRPRALSLTARADRAIVLDLFAERAATSLRFGLLDFQLPFFWNALAYPWTLSYLEEDELLVVLDLAPPRVRVIDVVARKFPEPWSLSDVLPTRTREIEVHFPPDRLSGAFAREPRREPDVLMVRGEVDDGGGALAFPPSASF